MYINDLPEQLVNKSLLLPMILINRTDFWKKLKIDTKEIIEWSVSRKSNFNFVKFSIVNLSFKNTNVRLIDLLAIHIAIKNENTN